MTGPGVLQLERDAWKALALARAEMLACVVRPFFSTPDANARYEAAIDKAEKADAELRRLGAIP